ncbi:MAG: orotate phosphoribosyltransferase [Candidatus Delongbacteria bacterium]
MKDYKQEFIKFLIDNNSLKFGEFKLKSGRISPYFLNTGMLYSGRSILKLGEFYALTIADRIKEDFNVIFGPAYKGIPLAISCTSSLYANFNTNKDYSFNRKEIKTHGDSRSQIVGKQLAKDDRIVLIDDVITAGTAIRETVKLFKDFDSPAITAVVVSVDRMEKGCSERSAVQELQDDLGIKFYSIVNTNQLHYTKDYS